MEDLNTDSRLKEKFGEDVVKDLDRWVRKIIQSETQDQYRQILSRLDIIEDRYEGLSDEVYRLRGEMSGFRTEVNQRFDAMRDNIDQRFDAMGDNIDQRFDSVNLRFDTMKGYIDQRFEAMNSSLDRKFDVIDQKFDVMNQRIVSSIKWSVGTISIFGLIITVLVTVFKFLG